MRNKQDRLEFLCKVDICSVRERYQNQERDTMNSGYFVHSSSLVSNMTKLPSAEIKTLLGGWAPNSPSVLASTGFKNVFGIPVVLNLGSIVIGIGVGGAIGNIMPF